VLPEELADDEERHARFAREARMLASLNHANVARIHGVDEDGGVYFLALELIEGEELATRLARGRLAVEEGSTSAASSPPGSKRRTRPVSCTATSSHRTCA